MELKSIKEAADKTPVDSVRGVIEKQYAPADQTENDLKWSQHRQSLLITDADGNKLMVTLMKEPLHILDNVEGHELILTAGRNDKNELRGLVVNRWHKAGEKYESVILKVYPEASIRAVPPGGKQSVDAGAPKTKSDEEVEREIDTFIDKHESSQPTEFEKTLQLAAVGYCLCLDKATQMVDDRPLLQRDPESIRAIATNLWMSSKHHVATLAPGLRGTKEAARGSAPTPKNNGQGPSPAKPSLKQTDDTVIDRVLKGGAMDQRQLNEKAKAKLAELHNYMDQAGLWDKAYDRLLINLVATRSSIEDKIRAAANQVYDETRNAMGENVCVEKFFVCEPVSWREAVLEQCGRNEE